jgi:hypothetical protein
MDAEASLGAAMRRRTPPGTVILLAGIAFVLVLSASSTTVAAAPAGRYALVVSGVSGIEEYRERFDGLRSRLVRALMEQHGFEPAQIVVLSEEPQGFEQRATSQNVRRAVGELARKVPESGLLLVVMIGHGTFDGLQAKFNLVGPDLDAGEWNEILGAVRGRLVVVNTTASSFPFLEALSGEKRVVITATDSTVQRYTTVFPGFFVDALSDPAADLDKDGRVSLWEAFAHASAGVRQWYEKHGRLATERALMDDNGDGIGSEALGPGADGQLARTTWLDAGSVAATADIALAAMYSRRDALMERYGELKASKQSLAAEEYEAEIEKVLVELALVSRDIRAKESSRAALPIR